MAPGAPRAKRKVTRGGGKHFSRDLRPLDEPMEKPESSAEEEESEEGSEAEDGASCPDGTITREERKAATKARKEAAKARHAGPATSDDEEEEEETKPAKTAPKKAIAVSNPNDPANAAAGGLSRREREALEAAAAKERYWKLQQSGKTDQAKADMARLAKIREEREEKAKQRKAELEEKKKEAEAKADNKGGRRR